MSIVTGKFRYDLAAFGGLLFLGFFRIINTSQLFSGFASPALFTIIMVLIISTGMVESGVLAGFGKSIAKKIHKTKNQIFVVSLSTSFLSAFMNNVGAMGLFLPTTKRMARRSNLSESDFVLPILYASILGGSATLIGTASNLIVSSYRFTSFGEPFKMFDFTLPGLVLILSGILIIFILKKSTFSSMRESTSILSKVNDLTEKDYERDTKKSLIILLTLIPAIIFIAIGFIHAAVGFGLVIIIWIMAGLLSYESALSNISSNLPVIIFIGSMLGISVALEETGALGMVINLITPLFSSLSPLPLILIFLFITVIITNTLGNTVAAVLMAPLAIGLWKSGAVNINPDALLMAVAAGSSLGIILPTHQVAIVVMNSMNFPRKSYMKTGATIAITAGILVSLLIFILWK